MRHNYFSFLLVVLMSMTVSVAFAYDAVIDGIYYEFSENTANVTYGDNIGGNQYSGSVTIPSSVTYEGITYEVKRIYNCAFKDCNDLTSITIPESLITIGRWAFEGCNGLTTIVVQAGNPIFDSREGCNAIIETVSNTLVVGCKNTIIPESVTSIGEEAFSECVSLTNITIPESVTWISYDAFYGCSGLTSITIPESVTRIDEGAFRYCSGLTSIVVKEGNKIYDSRNECNAIITKRDNCLIAGCINTIIPENVTGIGNSAFSGCKLTSITIPNSVEAISGWAFNGCRYLTSIVIPGSVTKIYEGAFRNCSSLTSVTLNEGITYISDAFDGCSSLTSITIPASVTSMGNPVPNCSNLTSIVVADGNTVYDSRNGCNAIIETASNTLIVGCMNTIIPEGVTNIGGSAFAGCSGLTSIDIPEGVTNIGGYTFHNCNGLTSIRLPNSLTSIGYSAFSECEGLTSITIPESVTIIDWWAFAGCRGLTTITIPESVTTIGNYAFYGCTNLTSINIPEAITNISDETLDYCWSLSSVRVGMKTPIVITPNVFAYLDKENTILYVPKGSKAAYEVADVWKDFGEITEYNYLELAEQTIVIGGKTATLEIGVNNGHTNLVAFQMDLTLPEGISLDKTGCSLSSRITDEKQELTIGKLENGAYRLTSSSLSLTPISGTEGTLLTLKITATEDCDDGQATISNIRFSTAGSKRVDMPDETFDIDILHKFKLTYKLEDEVYKTSDVIETTPLTLEAEPTKDGYTFGGWSELPETMPGKDVEITGRFYLYGDVNTDEEVDVVDVVDIARFVVATPSGKFREKLADLNKDNSVNLGDAVVLVNHIAGDVNFVKAMAAPNDMIEHGDALSLTKIGKTLALNLTNRRAYTAFQFDLYVAEDTNVAQMALNAQRKHEHQLLYNKVENGHYRVAVLSTSNRTFNGNDGELLSFIMDAEPSADTEIRNIRFFDTKGIAYAFDAIGIGLETGLKVMQDAASKAQGVIYDLQGRKLTKAQRGVNIVNGKTLIIKK